MIAKAKKAKNNSPRRDRSNFSTSSFSRTQRAALDTAINTTSGQKRERNFPMRVLLNLLTDGDNSHQALYTGTDIIKARMRQLKLPVTKQSRN